MRLTEGLLAKELGLWACPTPLNGGCWTRGNCLGCWKLFDKGMFWATSPLPLGPDPVLKLPTSKLGLGLDAVIIWLPINGGLTVETRNGLTSSWFCMSIRGCRSIWGGRWGPGGYGRGCGGGGGGGGGGDWGGGAVEHLGQDSSQVELGRPHQECRCQGEVGVISTGYLAFALLLYN